MPDDRSNRKSSPPKIAHPKEPDQDEVITAYHKNQREEVRFLLKRFRGILLADARVWWSKDGESYRPGPKGICMRVEQWPEFCRGVAKLSEVLLERGLLEAEDFGAEVGGESGEEGEDFEGCVND